MEQIFNQIFALLLHSLDEQATLVRIEDTEAWFDEFNSGEEVAAVLVGDTFVVQGNPAIWRSLEMYMHYRGGKVIVMGFFFTPSMDEERVNRFLARAGVDWVFASKGVKGIRLQQRLRDDPRPNTQTLPRNYRTGGVFLTRVSEDEMWYGERKEKQAATTSALEDAAGPGVDGAAADSGGGDDASRESLETTTLEVVASAAMTRMGEGHFGFVGDMPWNLESNDVLLAMCGLQGSEMWREV